MRTLYLEPFSGMAGDMFLAALLDLGDPRFTLDDLKALAESLVPGESRLELETAWRGNLSGQLLSVHTSESESTPHRGYADLERIIERTQLPVAVKRRSAAILMRIAVAEAKIHGTTPDKIHFHEIGAVDTLIDVCGAVFALERLGVERVVSIPPVTGTGTVRCAHGEMPVPAPAVAELLRGKPMSISGGGGERLTPTGAALIAEFVASFDEPGDFVSERIGYGAGARDPKVGPPNILRVQLGRVLASAAFKTHADAALEPQAGTTLAAQSSNSAERASLAPAHAERTLVWLCEVNLDDMTGEEIAHIAAHLRTQGALDVWLTPVVMKKERPGVVLSVLCRAEQRTSVEQAILDRTTTFGLRWRACERLECGRGTLSVDVEGHAVRVKVRVRPSLGDTVPDERDLSPEHDDVAQAARALGWSLRQVERRAVELVVRSVSSQDAGR